VSNYVASQDIKRVSAFSVICELQAPGIMYFLYVVNVVYEFCSGFAYAPKMQPVVASRDIESLEHEPVSTAAVKSQKWFQNLKSSLIFFFSLLFFRECCRLYASVSLWIDH
jgi:hypothetical protein